MLRNKIYFVLTFQLLILIILVLFALQLGAEFISIPKIIKILMNYNTNDVLCKILINLRFPRILLAIIIGATLSLAGAIYQSILQNSLADPYLLGVANGGAFFYSFFFIFLRKSEYFLSTLPVFTFLGSLITIIVVIRLSENSYKKLNKDSIILAGVVIGTFFNSLTILLMALSGEQMQNIFYFLMGNLGIILTSRNILYFLSAAIFLLIGIMILVLMYKEMNIMSLGDELAESMGVNVTKYRKWILLVTSAMVGLVVSIAGIIGFVGLIAPHISRIIIGSNNKKLFPVSILTGSILLLFSDILARSIYKYELPIGIITSLCGAPYFLYLLLKKGKYV